MQSSSSKQRDALLHEQVRRFAQAGWLPSARGTDRGYRWWWYRDGVRYVICGVRLDAHDPSLVDVADADITESYSPEEVARICGTTS